MEDKFKRTEGILYNYRSLEAKIKSIEIDIEDLENDISVKAISYDEKSGPTNAFNSTVENEVVRREEKIDTLKAKLKYNQNLKTKIEAALDQLTSDEYKLISLRYLGKDKCSWAMISTELGYEKNYCNNLRRKIVNKIKEIVFP